MNQNRFLWKSCLKVVALLLVLSVTYNCARAQTTYYDNYSFRIPLTLNNASLGISTDQTNFVALVKVTSPTFASAVCSDQTGGLSSTIPVFAIIDSAYSTTTELNYQVENYNTTTGVIYFWVKIPTLYKTGSVNGSNKLYCYFGSTSPSVSHTTNWQKLTWSNVTGTAGISYSGVYHFNEDPSGAAPQFADATVNNNNLSTASSLSVTSTGTVTQNTSSQIGNGITLAATSVLDIGATNLPNTTASQTLSLWASYPVAPTATMNFIVLENSTNPATTGNGTQLGVLLNGGAFTLQAWRWANRTTPLVKSSTIPSAVTWHHFAYSYDSVANKSYLYVDGALLAGPTSNSSNKPFSGKADMVSFGDYINNNIGGSGIHAVGGQDYTGTMDESHVIGCTLSADWIKAEYVNQKDPDAFTTAGTMQTNSVRASAVAGYLVYTWKGASTTVTSATNWDNTTSGTTNEAPVNSNVNWVIPAGQSHYPVLTANTGLYALTLAAGASINLNGHTLSVGCNIYNSSGGQILYNSNTASQITWNGSISSQYYYGTNTALTAQVGNMTVNNSSAGTVNITGGPVDIFNLLTITSGNLVIASSATVTLKSTANQTAGVAAITSPYTISGNVTAERYLTGGSGYRSYRLISSPVYTATVSSNNIYSLSYLQNAMWLTGNAGGGFDKTGNPTLYLYREDEVPSNVTFTSGNFWGISAINNTPSYNYYLNGGATAYNLPVGNGMFVFFRGNKSAASLATETTTAYTTNVTATLSTTGTLNQGTIVVHDWYTPASANIGYTGSGTGKTTNKAVRGFNLIGNPYASSIDWHTFSNTSSSAAIYGVNVGPSIWMLNPHTKNYDTYNATTGVSTGSASNIIASGQGFFVQAIAPTVAIPGLPSLTFKEAAKTNSQVTSGSSLLMDKRTGLNALSQSAYGSYLRLNLITDTANNDDMVIGFSPASTMAFNPLEDAKFMNGAGNLQSIATVSSDSILTSVKWLPYPGNSADRVIRLKVEVNTSGTYTLQRTDFKAIPQIYEVWLMDKYKKDSLDIRNNSTYVFDVDVNDTSSYGGHRFAVVIRQNAALAVHLLNFNAAKVQAGSQVVWSVENEQNYTGFTVERSTDGGATFTILGGMTSSADSTYSFLDKNPANGADLYRLQITDLNGTITYSNIVTLMYGNAGNLVKTGITVYPNPAKSTLNLSIATGFNPNTATVPVANAVQGTAYDIQITNILGAVIKKTTIAQQNWQTDVSSLMPGSYVIQVVNKSNNTPIGQDTFIKL